MKKKKKKKKNSFNGMFLVNIYFLFLGCIFNFFSKYLYILNMINVKHQILLITNNSYVEIETCFKIRKKKKKTED
jgi:hypothetical protein